MIFNAVVYHVDKHLVFRLFSTDTSPKPIDERKEYFTNINFSVTRIKTLEITPSCLFLPGDKDINLILPRIITYNFISPTDLSNWLNNYSIAYREVNKCEPTIINLDEVPETEDAPEMRLA